MINHTLGRFVMVVAVLNLIACGGGNSGDAKSSAQNSSVSSSKSSDSISLPASSSSTAPGANSSIVSSSSVAMSSSSSLISVSSSSILLNSSSTRSVNSSSSLPVSSSSSLASSSAHSLINAEIVFDDFSYSLVSQMEANNWYVRSGGGGPGVSGASWSKGLVTFFDDPTNDTNTLMRMKASTQGTGNTTTQSQITYEGKHLRGTYAARMYFNNGPASGPDGDQIVETFYTITPLAFDMDPDYSEIDFEYLANGGWGQSQPTMFLTTWETYKPDPWTADNTSDPLVANHSGWHTLVAQVDENSVRYYIDGQLKATHTGKVYPETEMSLNFNIWFIQGGLVNSTTERVYEQDVDWVYFVDQEILSTVEVEEQIQALRDQSITYRDTFN